MTQLSYGIAWWGKLLHFKLFYILVVCIAHMKSVCCHSVWDLFDRVLLSCDVGSWLLRIDHHVSWGWGYFQIYIWSLGNTSRVQSPSSKWEASGQYCIRKVGATQGLLGCQPERKTFCPGMNKWLSTFCVRLTVRFELLLLLLLLVQFSLPHSTRHCNHGATDINFHYHFVCCCGIHNMDLRQRKMQICVTPVGTVLYYPFMLQFSSCWKIHQHIWSSFTAYILNMIWL